jgi:hypothetical protein
MNHLMKKYYIYAYLLLLALPYRTFAAYDPLSSLKTMGKAIYGTDTEPLHIEDIIGRLVQILLSFVGIIFIILIVMGGVQWMTAGGNEQRLEKAKKRITQAAIGLAIVVAAYVIAFWISDALRYSTTTTPTK